MFILRLIGVLAVVVIGTNILLWIGFRDRRYLGYAWRTAQGVLMLALAVMMLFLAERLLIAF